LDGVLTLAPAVNHELAGKCRIKRTNIRRDGGGGFFKCQTVTDAYHADILTRLGTQRKRELFKNHPQSSSEGLTEYVIIGLLRVF
jgi:hypothetical protein